MQFFFNEIIARFTHRRLYFYIAYKKNLSIIMRFSAILNREVVTEVLNDQKQFTIYGQLNLIYDQKRYQR